jgi:hypothetical protein
MKLHSVETWLLGLLSAVIGGAATAISMVVVDPMTYNIHEGWNKLLEVAIVSGVVSAAFYLKQSPVPKDPEPARRPRFPLSVLAVLVVPAVLLCSGCATIQQHEPEAAQAADWVKHNSGLIQVGTQAIATALIYASPEGTDKQKAIRCTLAVATNLDRLLTNRQLDPDSVRAAFKIKEPWFDSVMDGAAALYESKYWQAKKNGYTDAAESLLKAVTAGLLDALPQEAR